MGSLFLNAQDAIPLIITLEELGHKQEAIPLKTDNSTADGILNKTIKQKRSKAFDMRFHWLCDRVEQGQFRVFWAPGKLSLGDYFTKRHPESHHKNMRHIYLWNKENSPSTLQGCAKLRTQAVSNNDRTSGKNKHTNGQTNTASTTDTWTKVGRAYYNDTCQNIELAKIIARRTISSQKLLMT